MTTPKITAEAYAQAIARKMEVLSGRDDDASKFALGVLSSIEDCAAELTAARASEDQGEARNAPVAWAWRTVRDGKGMDGWALGHIMPTRENCHLKEGDELEVRPLVFGEPPECWCPETMIVNYCPRCVGVSK